MVKHRGEGGEEDDHRQDLEREDEPFVRENGAEKKLYPLVGGVDDRLHGVG